MSHRDILITRKNKCYIKNILYRYLCEIQISREIWWFSSILVKWPSNTEVYTYKSVILKYELESTAVCINDYGGF